jgi:methionine biosynthesis protein MetW
MPDATLQPPNAGSGARRREIRVDLQRIADMVPAHCRLLDIGCGDGVLLDYLVHEKGVDGRGIEISVAGVNAAITHGLSVIQGDADTDLDDYPDNAFDVVVLSQTLQAMRNPRKVLENLMRIGTKAIVSFPNFGYWRVRLRLLVWGDMPKTKALPFEWYDTPNIHQCTIKDFVRLADELGITIERSIALKRNEQVRRIGSSPFLANLMGEQALFLLSKAKS